jgi:hypothetical protein
MNELADALKASSAQAFHDMNTRLRAAAPDGPQDVVDFYKELGMGGCEGHMYFAWARRAAQQAE